MTAFHPKAAVRLDLMKRSANDPKRTSLEVSAGLSKFGMSDTVGDLDAFMAFFAEDARFLPPDGPQANGRDEIRQSFAELAALPGFSLTWSANFSDVSSSGDLGYSVGTFEMTADGPDGNPATRTGTYATVWKKQNDGQWKVVSDIPNFDSPAG